MAIFAALAVIQFVQNNTENGQRRKKHSALEYRHTHEF